MIRHAVGYLGHANDSSGLKFRGVESVLATSFMIDVQRGVNQKLTSVLCWPRPILDVLGAVNDEVGPWLSNRENLHICIPLMNMQVPDRVS
jgi:hypothetical protein